jgi:large subunit ribosomal protein L3
MAAILGKKLGMTQIFTEDGDRVPVTVIEAGPCTITQIKSIDREGYSALQIGFGEVKERRVNKPQAGHFKKAGVKPTRHLAEIRCDLDEAAAWIQAPEAQQPAKAKKGKAKAKEAEKKETAVAEQAETEGAEVTETEAEAAENVEAAPEAEEAGVTEAEAVSEEEAVEAHVEEAVEAPAEAPGGAVLGGRITVEAFEAGQKIKVSGVSKGKGFAGVIKRHGFAGGPKSHGSHFQRAPGSVGASAYPSRVFKGLKLPGHMGNKKRTQRGLKVFSTDPENNLLFVKGAVPGSTNGIVFIQTES